MHRALFLSVFAALCWVTAPARAATIVTTADSQSSNVICCYQADGVLAPFDSSLGRLTAIILQVDATSHTGFAVGTNTPLSQEVTFGGTVNIWINGVAYPVDVSGSRTITGLGLFFTDLIATGSATFTLDQSLFSSFVDRFDHCTGASALGICASNGITYIFPDVTPAGSSWAVVGGTDTRAHYTLRYVFAPVPEPATWAMMLLGFAGIGLAVRKRATARPEVA